MLKCSIYVHTMSSIQYNNRKYAVRVYSKANPRIVLAKGSQSKLLVNLLTTYICFS